MVKDKNQVVTEQPQTSAAVVVEKSKDQVQPSLKATGELDPGIVKGVAMDLGEAESSNKVFEVEHIDVEVNSRAIVVAPVMVENAFDVLATDDEVVKDTFAQEQQQVIRESQQITREWGLVGEELEPTSAAQTHQKKAY
ncbi:hypothetical protein FRX31_003367 [Thalictrum thalictroides]|uniref:Uncharacterized protein n=1 Tax=Thalictrum thalictroides TaxID=46969 RepID=A0A7J6XB71_THATH|nr:hypothetical protein FRX31_003367 [Thalictrum thalictroides]